MPLLGKLSYGMSDVTKSPLFIRDGRNDIGECGAENGYHSTSTSAGSTLIALNCRYTLRTLSCLLWSEPSRHVWTDCHVIWPRTRRSTIMSGSRFRTPASPGIGHQFFISLQVVGIRLTYTGQRLLGTCSFVTSPQFVGNRYFFSNHKSWATVISSLITIRGQPLFLL